MSFFGGPPVKRPTVCFERSRPCYGTCCDYSQVFANFNFLLRNERSIFEVATSKNIRCERRCVNGPGLPTRVYEGTSREWLENDFISKRVANFKGLADTIVGGVAIPI